MNVREPIWRSHVSNQSEVTDNDLVVFTSFSGLGERPFFGSLDIINSKPPTTHRTRPPTDSGLRDISSASLTVVYKDTLMDLTEEKLCRGLPYQIIGPGRPYQLRHPETGRFLAIKKEDPKFASQNVLTTHVALFSGSVAPCWYFQQQPCGSYRLCAKAAEREFALCRLPTERDPSGEVVALPTENSVLPNDDWTVEFLGGQTANFYVVKQRSSAACLDVSPAGVVCLNQFTGRVTQLWCLLPGTVVP